MTKSIFYLLFTFFLLFSGCDSTNTDTGTSIPVQTQNVPLQENRLLANVSATNIEAGESVDFYISDTSQIKSVEWKDETGKVLSTDLRFNRLFNEPGTYETIVVIDQNGQVKTERVVVEVTPTNEQSTSNTNQPPVVKAKAESLDIMDGEYIHLSDDGSYDPDGTIVKYEWRDMDGILLSSSKTLDRVLHYDLQYDFNHDGTTRYVKTLYVTDDKGAVSSKSFTIIVHKKTTTPTPPADTNTDTTPANTPTTPSNHAPTALSKTFTFYSGESMMIVLEGTDADGDTLSYRIVQQPQHGTLSNDLPNVVYTSDYGYIGEDSFTYVVNDGKVDSAPVTVHLTVTYKQNQAPVNYNITKTYTYDSAGRVIREDFNNGTYIEYTYDDNGNLINQNVVGGK